MRSDAFIEAARCRDFTLEWLDTNGIGGSAAGPQSQLENAALSKHAA